jgi:hypothetical protein
MLFRGSKLQLRHVSTSLACLLRYVAPRSSARQLCFELECTAAVLIVKPRQTELFSSDTQAPGKLWL